MNKIKLGIIKERKTPPDYRVPLTPQQCKQLLTQYPDLDVTVESSAARCYSDDEYQAAGIQLVDDIGDRDIVLGVKEVPVADLPQDKTLLIFSHTYKKQPYNRKLLQAMVANNIKLVDYELLTDDDGIRVIAFGRFAGLVGAHNGLLTWGKRTGLLDLKRAHEYKDLAEMKASYKDISIPPLKIVLTGNGRVAKGALEILEAMDIKRVSPYEYLNISKPNRPVYVQLDSDDLYKRKDGSVFEFSHFFDNPSEYISAFEPYTHGTDLMINAIYWDPAAPAYFSRKDMLRHDFDIRVIADITCDIEGSIPATLRATTIAEPFMGYDPVTGLEAEPFQDNVIDIMSIDNLPNELPRDASQAFGEQLIANVIPQLLGAQEGDMIEKATITEKGKLGTYYTYLSGYLAGEE